MSTLKQKIAARANGAKSRGPVTDAGKGISSRNAVRHGMLSATFLFDSEKHEFFDELVANLYDEHQPSTETERVLLETMAISRWRQMRLWAMENTMLTEEMTRSRLAAGPNAPPITLPQCSAEAFRNLTENGRGLQLVMRYEAQSFRTFVRCLKTLTEIQENTPDIKECETNPIIDFPEENQPPAAPDPEPDPERARSGARVAAGSHHPGPLAHRPRPTQTRPRHSRTVPAN